MICKSQPRFEIKFISETWKGTEKNAIMEYVKMNFNLSNLHLGE